MTPVFTIIADGADITAAIQSRLLSLNLTDKQGVSSDTLTITIDDSDGVLRFPKKGAKLEVSIGYLEGPLTKMGSFVVDEVEVSGPPNTMTIQAKAASMGGQIKAPRERSWHDKKLGEIAKTIAKENDLTPVVEAESAKIEIEHADQTDSDLNFLTRLCADNGQVMSIKDGKLYIKPIGDGKGAGGKSMPKVILTAQMITSWRAQVADRNEFKSVKAYYQDVAKAERKSVTSGSGKPELTLKHTYASKGNAERAAKSALETSTAAGGEISINMPGNPAIKPEQKLVVSGVRQGIDGIEYTIAEVGHSIDGGGYKTTIKADLGSKKT